MSSSYSAASTVDLKVPLNNPVLYVTDYVKSGPLNELISDSKLSSELGRLLVWSVSFFLNCAINAVIGVCYPYTFFRVIFLQHLISSTLNCNLITDRVG